MTINNPTKLTKGILSDIAEIIMGQSPEGESYNKEGIGVPLINGPTEFGETHPITIQWTNKPTKYANNNDLLLCVRGSSIGRMNLANDTYCIGRGVAAIRPLNAEVNSDYLYFLIEKNVTRILKNSTGSTFPNLSGAELKSFPIAIPNLNEQQLIGAFFRKISAKIQLQQKKIDLLKEQKEGFIQKIFSLEFRFKDEDGKDYPSWSKQKLSSFAERVTRKNSELITTRPLTISAQYGLIDQTEFFNKTVASGNLTGYYLLQKGEFAYNKSYSKGYPLGAIKRLDNYENGALSTLYICFSIKENVDSDFLVHYFDSSQWHQEVALICVEGARNHGLLNVSVNEFFETQHSTPCLEEQKKIAGFLNKINKRIELNEQTLMNLQQQKQAFMQQMFI